jgi:hypothetical protein
MSIALLYMRIPKSFTKRFLWLQTAFPIVVFLSSLGAASLGKSIAEINDQSRITVGPGNFQFIDNTGRADRTIRVWFYCPQTLRANSPIVFVMHGVERDAERYCRDWTPYAQQQNFLLICPGFNAEDFPTKAYQCGNMFDELDKPLPESKWTFTTIENLFDYVRKSTANSSVSYYIYGHSAGGQFVHRFVLFMPNARYKRAIAANPGWYTMPTYSAHRFPYGLRGSNLSESSLKRSFGRDFQLLLGTDDIDSQEPELRKTRAAEEQGATRFARGQTFFKAAQGKATDLEAQFNWQLQTVPGARHSDAQMAQAAVAAFFAK